jgi:hypothetical protein
VALYDEETMERLPLPNGRLEFKLGEVNVKRPPGFELDPYRTRQGLHLEEPDEPLIAPGFALEGFSMDKERANPQEVVSVMLKWRALKDGLPRYEPILRLRKGDRILVEVRSELFEKRYPTDKWAEGEVVFEQRDFLYPSIFGKAMLEIEIGEKVLPLAQMELEVPMRHRVGIRFGQFAELMGYDITSTEVTTDERVKLTLYWRAISEEPVPTSYTVFTHILDEAGRLIGQHDGLPAGGTRPTTSWVKEEVIVDTHEMEFSDLNYVGRGIIEVGLYDLRTMERVKTEEGDDRVILPSEVVVR